MGGWSTPKPIDKANSAYEVGEVGVVEQVGKVKPEPRKKEGG